MQLTDAMADFERDIKKCTLQQSELVDFKKEVIELSKPQMTDWGEYVRNKMLFQMEWELVYRLGSIEMHRESIDQDLVKQYQQCQLEHVRVLIMPIK